MAKLKFYVAGEILYVASASHGFSLRATSGKGDCMSSPSCSGLAWEGPIPKGLYLAYGYELTDKSAIWDLARLVSKRGDFGDWRIPLHPSAGTATFGRDGFFIHCGVFDGSAGCIDVGGGLAGDPYTDYLKQALLLSQASEVWVY